MALWLCQPKRSVKSIDLLAVLEETSNFREARETKQLDKSSFKAQLGLLPVTRLVGWSLGLIVG